MRNIPLPPAVGIYFPNSDGVTTKEQNRIEKKNHKAFIVLTSFALVIESIKHKEQIILYKTEQNELK